MIIYWLLLAGTIGVGIPLCKEKFGKNIYCVGMWAVLFSMEAVRANVGVDYNLYGTIYTNLQRQDLDNIMTQKMEKGFLIPMKYISDVCWHYQVMFVIIAFILVTSIVIYIYKNSDKPYLSFFFFLTSGLFFNSMCFMRQLIAAAIILYAMRYIKNNQTFRFVVFVLFASSIHISSLIMIPIFFIAKIKMSKKVLGIYSAIILLAYLFSWEIIGFVTKYVYTIYDIESNYEVTHGIKKLYAIIFIVAFVVAFLLRKQLVKKDKFNNVLINFLFYAAVFEVMGTKHAVLSRFSLLFLIPSMLILMPQVIEVGWKFIKERIKNKKISLAVSIASATVLLGMFTGIYGYMIKHDYNGVTPYKTIFYEGAAEE